MSNLENTLCKSNISNSDRKTDTINKGKYVNMSIKIY